MHRRPIRLPVTRKELALEPRHIHAHGAFRFTRPALEAKIQHIVNAAIVQSGRSQTSAHRQAQHVSAAARRMRFLLRLFAMSGRAHGSFERLAAHAALHIFDRAAHSAVIGIIRKTSAWIRDQH